MPSAEKIPVREIPVDLERDPFLRDLLRELTGVLEEVVGMDQAAGFISVVGQRIGEQINQKYSAALQIDRIAPVDLADVLVDLKRRIRGDFYVIEASTDKIVLGNRACPFGRRVLGRPSLCMMTSNVFGVISAESAGYAKVAVEEAFAYGDDGCHVVIYLSRDQGQDVAGREYFRT